MLAVTLTFSIISVMFLLVGGVIGYLVKEYVIERNSTYIPILQKCLMRMDKSSPMRYCLLDLKII